MNYKLLFLPSALKEWNKLGGPIAAQMKKKLQQRLITPKIEANKLRGADMGHCYKIKLRASGYRLVYKVDEAAGTVTVITVGKRDDDAVYRRAGFVLNALSPKT